MREGLATARAIEAVLTAAAERRVVSLDEDA
jgi:hypothetical protein